jgi:hypothetical protein
MKPLQLGFLLLTCAGCDFGGITVGQRSPASHTTGPSPEARAQAREANFQRMRDEQAARNQQSLAMAAKGVADGQQAMQCLKARKALEAKLASVGVVTRIDPFFGDVEARERDLADARERFTLARSAFKDTCDEAPPDDVKLSMALNAYEKLLVEERACRPDRACMARRTAEHVANDARATCDALANLRYQQARLAHIRANGARFGVVNLYEVKEAGDDIVAAEARVRDARAGFAAQWPGKLVLPSLCAR